MWWELAIAAAVGSILTMAGQFGGETIGRRKDREERLRRDRIEAHSEFLTQVRITHGRIELQQLSPEVHEEYAVNYSRMYEDVVERLARASARVHLLSGPDTYKAAEKLSQALLENVRGGTVGTSAAHSTAMNSYLNSVRSEVGVKGLKLSERNPLSGED